MKILVTGAAGFIGSQLLARLKRRSGTMSLGLDNFNDHLYDPELKYDRCAHFGIDVKYCDIRNHYHFEELLVTFRPTHIVHLAALAGVRDSFGKESQYHDNNINGTQQLIDLCKKHLPLVKVIYASTSSVYGETPVPEEGWTEDLTTDKQRNAYAYSKYVNEIQFAISGLSHVGLRFFTVYGPWGRPDMALFDFTKKSLDNVPIQVYNWGRMKRDFTYVDDIIDGIEVVLDNDVPSGIYNIGYGEQVELMDFVKEIEFNTGRVDVQLVPRHIADTLETFSNTEKLQAYGYKPKTDIKTGVKKFYDWYIGYKNGTY